MKNEDVKENKSSKLEIDENIEESIIAEMREIIEDRIHGSSWILDRTIKLLKKIDPDLRVRVCEKISSSHTAMAGLKALCKVLSKNPNFDVEKVVSEANKRTSENLRNLVAGKIATTISRSHIVEKGLLEVKKAIILESRPGEEGKDVAKWLEEKGVEVEVIPDASMGYAVKESDFIVSGADSIFEVGFINKVGTLPLSLTSKHFGKPFIVASPSYKFLEKFGEFATRVRAIENTLFEFVDLKYVSGIVWEGGITYLEDLDKIAEIKTASAKLFDRLESY
jgi:translation initiation factor 2B subunit (eIF-2B alpha/beta/delta family)